MSSTTLPLHIVILGGSGDLAKRKLLPALYDLFLRGKLPDDFYITGVAKTNRSHEEYLSLVKESLSESNSSAKIEDFCKRINYVSGIFGDTKTYQELNNVSQDISGDTSRKNKLFYLAVPPEYYEEILVALQDCPMMQHDPDAGWSRILIEKPFGHDFMTAQKLDQKLSSLYSEEQIFRIDHYLAKEAVQNILSFRFANPILEPVWNSDCIESVKIIMHEEITVGSRGNFYETIGALRDVGQNHLLQMLALVAMERPKSYETEDVRTVRAEALNTLETISEENISKSVIRAQYEGYQDETGLKEPSETETFFEIKATLDNGRWRDVPFYISAGKGLGEAEVAIEITFKNNQNLFNATSCATESNVLRLTISSEQTMSLKLNAKSPGLAFNFEPRTLSFTCEKGDDEIKNSYEKVLFDCIEGDQMLFTSTKEVLAAWKFITPILQNWKTVPLQTYREGSKGPEERLF